MVSFSSSLLRGLETFFFCLMKVGILFESLDYGNGSLKKNRTWQKIDEWLQCYCNNAQGPRLCCAVLAHERTFLVEKTVYSLSFWMWLNPSCVSFFSLALWISSLLSTLFLLGTSSVLIIKTRISQQFQGWRLPDLYHFVPRENKLVTVVWALMTAKYI